MAVRLLGIAVSNPARSVEFFLLWVLCVVREADRSSREVLPSVVYLSVISQR
jgi:hypothetical protein